jgi:hypothetical protein
MQDFGAYADFGCSGSVSLPISSFLANSSLSILSFATSQLDAQIPRAEG